MLATRGLQLPAPRSQSESWGLAGAWRAPGSRMPTRAQRPSKRPGRKVKASSHSCKYSTVTDLEAGSADEEKVWPQLAFWFRYCATLLVTISCGLWVIGMLSLLLLSPEPLDAMVVVFFGNNELDSEPRSELHSIHTSLPSPPSPDSLSSAAADGAAVANISAAVLFPPPSLRAVSPPKPDRPPPYPPPTPMEPPPSVPPSPTEPPLFNAAQQRVVDVLNARFESGGPNEDLQLAGVFIRSFDGLMDDQDPWKPCTRCRSPDRFPASIVYPSHTDVYSNGPGGFVISSVGISIYCSCYADCGSQGKSCPTPFGDENCKPGCLPPCDPDRGTRNWGCSWHGDAQLPNMMRQQMEARAGGGYNEVVLDPRTWVAKMPDTIEAMFVLPTSSDENIRRVRNAHARFMDAYALTPDQAPPIVMYDPQSQPLAPFRVYRTSSSPYG